MNKEFNRWFEEEYGAEPVLPMSEVQLRNIIERGDLARKILGGLEDYRALKGFIWSLRGHQFKNEP